MQVDGQGPQPAPGLAGGHLGGQLAQTGQWRPQGLGRAHGGAPAAPADRSREAAARPRPLVATGPPTRTSTPLTGGPRRP